MAMKVRITFLCFAGILLFCLCQRNQAGLLLQGGIYQLIRLDGEVVAYTEFRPGVGDTYWHAEEDTWYHVVKMQGDLAWVVPESEFLASPARKGNIVFMIGWTLLVGVAAWKAIQP